MTDIHIDDFCKDVGLILVHLYRSFPQRSTLYVEDIIGSEEPDEFGLHSNRHLNCLGAMIWLAEEGYLRYDDLIRQEAMDQVVISRHCFTRLNTPSEFLVHSADDEQQELPGWIKKEKQLYVNQIRAALSTGSSQMISGIMKHFLTAF